MTAMMKWRTDWFDESEHPKIDIDSVLIVGKSPRIFKVVGVSSVHVDAAGGGGAMPSVNKKALSELDRRGGGIALQYYEFRLVGMGRRCIYVVAGFARGTDWKAEVGRLRTTYLQQVFLPAVRELDADSQSTKFGDAAISDPVKGAVLHHAIRFHCTDWSAICDELEVREHVWCANINAREVYYYVAVNGQTFSVLEARNFVRETCRTDAESDFNQVLVQLHVAVTYSPGPGRAAFLRDRVGGRETASDAIAFAREVFYRPYGLLNAGHITASGIKVGHELDGTVTYAQCYDPNVHAVRCLKCPGNTFRRVVVPYLLFGRYRNLLDGEAGRAFESVASEGKSTSEWIRRFGILVRGLANEVPLRIETVHTFRNLRDPLVERLLGGSWENDQFCVYMSDLVAEEYVRKWASALTEALCRDRRIVVCSEGWPAWVEATAGCWLDVLVDEAVGHAQPAANDAYGAERALGLDLSRGVNEAHVPDDECVRRAYDSEVMLLRYVFGKRFFYGAGGHVDRKRIDLFVETGRETKVAIMGTGEDDGGDPHVAMEMYRSHARYPTLSAADVDEARFSFPLPDMEQTARDLWRTLRLYGDDLESQAKRLLHMHALRAARLTGRVRPATFDTVYRSHVTRHTRGNARFTVRGTVTLERAMLSLTTKANSLLLRLILSGTVRRLDDEFAIVLRRVARNAVEIVPLFEAGDKNLRRWARVVEQGAGPLSAWKAARDHLWQNLNFRKSALSEAGLARDAESELWAAELVLTVGDTEKAVYEAATVMALYLADISSAWLDIVALAAYVHEHDVALPKLRRMGLLVEGDVFAGLRCRPALPSWLLQKRNQRTGLIGNLLAEGEGEEEGTNEDDGDDDAPAAAQSTRRNKRPAPTGDGDGSTSREGAAGPSGTRRRRGTARAPASSAELPRQQGPRPQEEWEAASEHDAM